LAVAAGRGMMYVRDLLTSGAAMALRLAPLFLIVLLSGCAGFAMRGLAPGVSTEAQVRAALGEPTMVVPGPEGTKALAYTTGPLGVQTWMARIGADGRLALLEQVLNDDQLSRIQPGVTTADGVLQLIGPPSRKMAFERKRQIAWDYRIQDSWGYYVDYSVMIDEKGMVAETVRARIEGGRSGRD
jgi:hypothetical protein